MMKTSWLGKLDIAALTTSFHLNFKDCLDEVISAERVAICTLFLDSLGVFLSALMVLCTLQSFLESLLSSWVHPEPLNLTYWLQLCLWPLCLLLPQTRSVLPGPQVTVEIIQWFCFCSFPWKTVTFEPFGLSVSGKKPSGSAKHLHCYKIVVDISFQNVFRNNFVPPFRLKKSEWHGFSHCRIPWTIVA